MVFTSVVFLFYFLPVFTLIYFITPGVQSKNLVLLLASLLFYAWGEAAYIAVMLTSIFVTYGFGIAIDRAEGRRRRAFMWLGVTVSLLILVIFKYLNFLVETVGIKYPAIRDGYTAIHLPIGISFFIFQSISYLVDVYRRDVRAERNFISIAAYISMFPQLMAGPIVRFASINSELKDRSHTIDLINAGVRIFIIGLAQKTLLANTFATPADAIFAIPGESLAMSTAWLGAISYTFQIYFDFAGYSNMAIGLGLMLGFTFPQNFNYPYISQSITEFWRRWHMSLSSWFRDYLYIPLGGNRGSVVRTYANLLIVFLLCGIWHGANWTFLIWGLYHGSFLVAERAGLGRLLTSLPQPVRHIYALLATIFGWVLFRAETLPQAISFMAAMLGFGATPMNPLYLPQLYLTPSVYAAILAGALASVPLRPLSVLGRMANQTFRLFLKLGSQTEAVARKPRVFERAVSASGNALLLVVLAVSLVFIGAGTYNPFIYFRF